MGESQSGGGVDTDVGYAGTSGTREPDSPRSYSNLGQSPIAMGGRPAPTPAPEVQTSSVDMPLLNDQDMSRNFFVNRASRSLMDLFGGSTPSATQTDDRGPSGADLGAVSVDDNQFNKGLASLTGTRASSPMSDFPSYMTSPRAGTDTRDENLDATDPTMAALRRAVPALNASYNRAPYPVGGGTSRPDFVFDYGYGSMPFDQGDTRDMGRDASPLFPPDAPGLIDARQRPAGGGDPLLFQDSRIMGMSPGAMGGRAPSYNMSPGAMGGLAPDEGEFYKGPGFNDGATALLGVASGEAERISNLAKSNKPKTQEELNIIQRLGRFLKGVGKNISNFEMNDIFEFLRGDPNYKGPSAAQLQLAQVPGPGPYVGGGVPSPSGGMGGGAPSPIQCPPGFKFDPVQNICVPIVAPAPPVTTTPAPGTTAPAPATGGISAIPNVYPFTLTPPIGAPIGNIAPVRS